MVNPDVLRFTFNREVVPRLVSIAARTLNHDIADDDVRSLARDVDGSFQKRSRLESDNRLVRCSDVQATARCSAPAIAKRTVYVNHTRRRILRVLLQISKCFYGNGSRVSATGHIKFGRRTARTSRPANRLALIYRSRRTQSKSAQHR